MSDTDAIIASLDAIILTLTHDVVQPLQEPAPGYYRAMALEQAHTARAHLRAAILNLRTPEQRSFSIAQADQFPTTCHDCHTPILPGQTYYDHTVDPVRTRRVIESLCTTCHSSRLPASPQTTRDT